MELITCYYLACVLLCFTAEPRVNLVSQVLYAVLACVEQVGTSPQLSRGNNPLVHVELGSDDLGIDDLLHQVKHEQRLRPVLISLRSDQGELRLGDLEGDEL